MYVTRPKNKKKRKENASTFRVSKRQTKSILMLSKNAKTAGVCLRRCCFFKGRHGG